jgi:hypothetical protein
VETGLHQSGDRGNERAGPGGEQDVRCGDAPTLDVEVEYADAVPEPVVAPREPGEDG